MATYTTRTITSTRREWIVPAAEPWGAMGADVSTAWLVAEAAYRGQHGLGKEQDIPGDAIRFRTEDDAIVISFTIEEPTA